MLFCLSEKHAMAALWSAFPHASPSNSAGTASEILLQHSEQLKFMMKITTNYGVALYKLPAC